MKWTIYNTATNEIIASFVTSHSIPRDDVDVTDVTPYLDGNDD